MSHITRNSQTREDDYNLFQGNRFDDYKEANDQEIMAILKRLENK